MDRTYFLIDRIQCESIGKHFFFFLVNKFEKYIIICKMCIHIMHILYNNMFCTSNIQKNVTKTAVIT